MTRITLSAADYGAFLITSDDGRDILVQSDWDFPGLATTFGWVISDVIGAPGHSTCYHEGTDGTIDCTGCGRTASEFIAKAQAYLLRHEGDEVDDVGYFPEVEPTEPAWLAEDTDSLTDFRVLTPDGKEPPHGTFVGIA